MHPSTLEASLDDQFVGTLDQARPNWPALLVELRVLHERFPFAEVTQVLMDALARQADDPPYAPEHADRAA